MKTEKLILAQITKQDGMINFEVPNHRDVFTYELYGFLKVYIKKLENDLRESIEYDGDN